MSQTSPPGPAPAATAPRSRPPLRRSRGDRKIGGVAGGLARYFDVDPLLVRIAFVVLAITAAGTGLLLYLACWLLVPEEGDEVSEARYFVDRHGKALAIGAGVVVVIALFTAAGPFGWGPRQGPWGLFVVLAAVAIFWVLRNDRRDRLAATSAASASGAPYTGPPPTSTAPQPGAYAAPYAAPYTTPYAQTAAYPVAQPHAAYSAAAIAAWEPKERSALGPLTVGAALVTAGVLVGLGRADDISVPAVVVLASTLAVVGIGLVIGAFIGRARGLIALGVVLSVLTAVAGVVELPENRSVGDVSWSPAIAAEVQESYSWGMGEAELDLRALPATSPVTTTSVELGIGDLRVVVPRTARVEVTAHVGAGTILLERGDGTIDTTDGAGRDVDEVLLPAGEVVGPTIVLDAEIGLGQLEVSRA